MAHPTAPIDPGYVWSGDLSQTRVTHIYAAFHSLRFTGQLDLRDENHSAQVVFLGGDPVEIQGGDTQAISLWNAGMFRAMQSLPNLAGELTGQVDQTGSLAVTKAPRLLAWVSEYRLTCDLTIERPGEQAHLVFKSGQLETARVNEQPELAALARVTAWTDGFYRVHLRPLFQGGVISLKPPVQEGAAPAGREFDVSRSIPLDLKRQAQLHSPQLGMVTVDHPVDASLEAERSAQQPAVPRASSGTDPVVPISQRPIIPPLPPPRRSSAKWPWVLLILVALGGGGVGAAYFLHLPPFAPLHRDPNIGATPAAVTPTPPKPIDKPVAPVDKPVAPADKPVAPVDKPVEPAHVEEKAKPDLASAAEAAKPDLAEAAHPVDPSTLEPKNTDKPPTTNPPAVGVSVEERLIQKGRILLIDGHPHSALSLFRKAEQLAPSNALAKTLQLQAMGKLGRAEILIEGKGHLNVDGRDFEAPKKIKTLAGPHAVDTGAGPEEVVIKKGERKKLRPRS
jgi:hypothetical protein